MPCASSLERSSHRVSAPPAQSPQGAGDTREAILVGACVLVSDNYGDLDDDATAQQSQLVV